MASHSVRRLRGMLVIGAATLAVVPVLSLGALDVSDTPSQNRQDAIPKPRPAPPRDNKGQG